MALARRDDATPLWLRATLSYRQRIPNHLGKQRLLRALFRLRALSSRPIPSTMTNGAVVALDPAEFGVVHSVSWRCLVDRHWEPEVEKELRERLSDGDVAFDVGANLGYFSAVMAQAVGRDGEVAAFEPVGTTFRRLEETRRWSSLPQIKAFNVAVGDHEGTVRLWHARESSAIASTSYRVPGGRQETVELGTIDGYVTAGTVRPPRLIKIDVEGHELDVVRGAMGTIRTYLPDLIFEVNPLMAGGAGWDISDIRDLVTRSAPYRFKRIDTGESVDVGPLDVAGDHVDVVAYVPQSASSAQPSPSRSQTP